MKVPYDEGGAIHIDPESCGRRREAVREALTGARIGQPLSGVRLHNPSAHALQSVEGNTARSDKRAAGRLGVVVRPLHVRTSPAREPRGLRASPASRGRGVLGKLRAQAHDARHAEV